MNIFDIWRCKISKIQRLTDNPKISWLNLVNFRSIFGQFSVGFLGNFGRLEQWLEISCHQWSIKCLLICNVRFFVEKLSWTFLTSHFFFKIASFWCHILRHFWCQIFNHQKIFNQLSFLAWFGNLVFNTIVLYFIRGLKLKNFRFINSLSGFVYWTSGWGLVVWDL